jgi:hypothetical protein
MTEKPSSGLNKIKFFDDGLEKLFLNKLDLINRWKNLLNHH